MRTRVEVAVPGFEGAFSCAVEINEFEHFVELLRHLHDAVGSECRISWGNIEGNIDFGFQLDRLGGLSGSYRFGPDSLGPHLSGEFSADQTYIQNWLKQAERVLRNAG
jgi:hypothetical protein